MRTYPFLSVLLVIAMMISHGSLLTVSQHFHKSDRPSVEATTEHQHFSENHRFIAVWLNLFVFCA